MRLVLLGTTGYHPNELRHTPCMMLPDSGVLLDAGTGMFRVRDLLCTTTLDIFLTHTHLDHVVGLTYLFDILYQRKMDRVDVHGDPQKLQAVQEHLFAADIFPVKPPFRWVPLKGSVDLPDGGHVSYFPLQHPGGCLGYRIDWPDRSLAYVTDTTAAAGSDYLEHIRGVDVLLHECYFADGWEEQAALTGHSCLTPVANSAKAADVGRLILVHVNPLSNERDPVGLETAKEIFPSTELGEDGMEIVF